MEMRYELSGTTDEKIMNCLKAAGWHKGRQAEISGVKAFYESCGIVLPAGAENFLREYYGIAEGWHMNTEGWVKGWHGHRVRQRADIAFELFPLRGMDNSWYAEEITNSEFLAELRRTEAFAGESLVWIGQIGYYYPANVYAGTTGKIYTTHDYDEIIHSYDSVPELLQYDFDAADSWHYVIMEDIVYDVNDPRGWGDDMQ